MTTQRELAQNIVGWSLVVLFTAINIFISPMWLLVILVGVPLVPWTLHEAFKNWLWLSTGQFAFPWWTWVNED